MSGIKETITYDTALDFLMEKDLLVDFIVGYLYESRIFKDHISDQLRAACYERFLRQRTEDMILSKRDFLNLCKRFICEPLVIGDYAEWLQQEAT